MRRLGPLTGRRDILSTLLAAVAAIAAIITTAHRPPADDHGSGPLGRWDELSSQIAREDEIRDVLMAGGVFLFGDSIAVQDGAALERLLLNRSGDPIAMHNWSGRPTGAAVDALDKWAHHYGLPQRIVMAVGSNDIFDPPAFAAQVDRAMRIAGPDRTVYWVTVHVRRTRQPAAIQAADQRNSDRINHDLVTAQDRHPNLRIIPWAEYLNARATRLQTHLRDGVHTSVPVGQAARNDLIVQALTSP